MNTRLLLLQIAAPVVAIAVGGALASGIIVAIGKSPLGVYATMVEFNTSAASIASILSKATPLILAGLAVALSFRVNLFNIGVEGQYFIGTFCAAFVGFAVRGLPAAVHLPLAVLAGMAGGMLWGLLPIALKLRRGAHEVITTIMMNYIASALLLWLIADVFRDPTQIGTPRVRTPEFAPGARIPSLRPLLAAFGFDIPGYSALNWFLPLGIVLCAIAAWALARTRFGYEVRAVAGNPDAAQAAGIGNARVQFMMFMASAAIAGLVGLPEVLGFFGYLDIDFPKGLGFLGISIALLGRNNPIGIIPAALLFGYLDRGAQGLQVLADVPAEVITILQALIILSIVVTYEVLTRYVRAQRKREAQIATARAVDSKAAAAAGQ